MCKDYDFITDKKCKPELVRKNDSLNHILMEDDCNDDSDTPIAMLKNENIKQYCLDKSNSGLKEKNDNSFTVKTEIGMFCRLL